MTDMLTMQDCWDAGFCVKGVRRVCVIHNLDFRAIARAGLPLAEAEKIEDINVKRACDKARERTNNGQ